LIIEFNPNFAGGDESSSSRAAAALQQLQRRSRATTVQQQQRWKRSGAAIPVAAEAAREPYRKRTRGTVGGGAVLGVKGHEGGREGGRGREAKILHGRIVDCSSCSGAAGQQ